MAQAEPAMSMEKPTRRRALHRPSIAFRAAEAPKVVKFDLACVISPPGMAMDWRRSLIFTTQLNLNDVATDVAESQ